MGVPVQSTEGADELHAFRPPNGASRSPCPALNTLANHAYLPHDGCGITFSVLVSSLQTGFGLSPGFAFFMAVGTFTLLRRPSLCPFDLHETAHHDYIEHHASMVHANAAPGAEYAPTEVDLNLLSDFLGRAHTSEHGNNQVITEKDIVEGRIDREDAYGPIGALHSELGRAEFAMVMEIFGKGMDKELSRDDLEVFLAENRFPEGWAPSRVLHLWEALARGSKLRRAMDKSRRAVRKEDKDPVTRAM